MLNINPLVETGYFQTKFSCKYIKQLGSDVEQQNLIHFQLTLSFPNTAIAIVKVGHSNLRPGSKGLTVQ